MDSRAGAAKSVMLNQVSMARLMFALLHQRFSGTLEVSQPAPNQGKRLVWFDQGMPVFTNWVEPTDVLGQVLIEMGVIRQEQLVGALEVMAQAGGLLGQILVKQGAVTPERLSEALRRQCARKLVRLFSLVEGRATATPGHHEMSSTMAKVNALELILAGVSVAYDEARCAGELGAAMHERVVATAAFQRYYTHFRFRPTDEPALRAMLGGTSLVELAALEGVSRTRAAQLIFALWACQMLHVGAAVGARPPSAARPQRVADAGPPPPSRPNAQPIVGGSPTSARPISSPRGRSRQPANPGSSVSPAPGRPAVSPARGNRTAGAATESPLPGARQPVRKRQSTIRDLDTSPPGAAASGDFETELREREVQIEGGTNAFALLGVELSAGKKEVRRAWSDLSRRFHPDALASQGLGHLKDRVSQVFAALSEAQMLLNDKEQRAKLRKLIESGESPDSAQQATTLARAAFQSEVIAKEADKLLKAGQFGRALERYLEASKLNPDELDIRAAIVWCQYNTSARAGHDANEAERALADIVHEVPRLARAHYFRGMVLKDLGAVDPALISFSQAHQHDPRLIDAERQARAIRAGRAQAEAGAVDKDKAKGRFGLKGLFGGRK